MATMNSRVSAGVTRVKHALSKQELDEQTSKRFDSAEQLKALMLQVEKLSAEAGIDLHPAFAEALVARNAIMADHRTRKKEAI